MVVLLLIAAVAFFVHMVVLEAKKAVSAESSNASAKSKTDFEQMAELAETQLIGGPRFLDSYEKELAELVKNVSFMSFVFALHRKLEGMEFIDRKRANKQIAREFYFGKLNERFPAVDAIAWSVRQYGKQASAHISIYYAMFILWAQHR